ncbi:MAG TPA: efflux transporter outer membrane subunit [Chthoniobacteraceae bacterium]
MTVLTIFLFLFLFLLIFLEKNLPNSHPPAAFLGIVLLSACTLGPNYKGPAAADSAAPDRYKNAGADGRWKRAEPSDFKAGGKWWTVFHDHALDGYVETALARNQDLRVAAGRINEAHAQARIAAADFYPQVTMNPSAERQRTTNTGPIQRAQLLGSNPFGGMTAAPGAAGSGAASSSAAQTPLVLATQPLTTTFDLFRAPLTANWEIDLFGRIRRETEAARATAQAVEADYQNMALSVSANAAVNYFALRALDTEADVLDRTIATRREALRIAEERLQAGLTSELDVARARADLASNEASLYALRRTRGQTEDALATLLGEPASDLRAPARPLASSDSPPRIPAGLPSELLERRPDVASAERQLAAANARIGEAKAAFFPRLTLSGAAGFESADIVQLFNWESRVWQIGASAVQPVFEGGRNLANLQASRARNEEAIGTYRAQLLKAFQEVEDALNDLRSLANQAEAQARSVAAARRALELSEQQYAHGSVAYLDVLDAQRTALANERVAAQLLGQRLQATVQLIKALGGAWK